MHDDSSGLADEYTVEPNDNGAIVYRNGQRVGHYWKDKWPGYAVFRAGQSKPFARPKTEAGCLRKLTDGAMDRLPTQDK